MLSGGFLIGVYQRWGYMLVCSYVQAVQHCVTLSALAGPACASPCFTSMSNAPNASIPCAYNPIQKKPSESNLSEGFTKKAL